MKHACSATEWLVSESLVSWFTDSCTSFSSRGWPPKLKLVFKASIHRVGFPGGLCCLVAQLYLTLCDPMDGSHPGSSVHRDSPGKNTGVGSHFLPQGIFPTQGSNLHDRQILYRLIHQRSWVALVVKNPPAKQEVQI